MPVTSRTVDLRPQERKCSKDLLHPTIEARRHIINDYLLQVYTWNMAYDITRKITCTTR
jgi:hypothetical protein